MPKSKTYTKAQIEEIQKASFQEGYKEGYNKAIENDKILRKAFKQSPEERLKTAEHELKVAQELVYLHETLEAENKEATRLHSKIKFLENNPELVDIIS